MKHRIKSVLPVFVLLTSLVVVYVLISKGIADSPGEISGTIETNQLPLDFKVGGNVSEILAVEGSVVIIGEVLLRLDDELLIAQYNQAAADLIQAEANYELLNSKPLHEQRMVDIEDAEIDVLTAQKALKTLIEDSDQKRANAFKLIEDNTQALEDLVDPNMQQALALENIAAASKAWDSANRKVLILATPPTQAVINQAYANLLLAESVLNQTTDDLEWARRKLQGNMGPEVPKEFYIDQYKSEFRQTVQALEAKLSRDRQRYDDALKKYQAMFEPPDPVELALSEAALAMAEAQLGQAQREYERVVNGPSESDIAVLEAKIEAAQREFDARQNGPDPGDLALAEARVRQAEAKLALAKVDTIEEQLKVTLSRIETAQAALDIVQAQLDVLVMTAPIDGFVLDRKIEAGEVVKPGTTAFTLAPLNKLTITLHFPREYYPSIQQGGVHQIQVDAFPDTFFTARVIEISDRNEYLPSNVTTDRSLFATVFSVEFIIEDPLGILKPGMMGYLELPPKNR